MAGDSDNARIWLNADVLVAPLGTDSPENLTDAWDDAWEDLGLLSEDGMTENRDEESDYKYAWGGGLVRRTRSKHQRSFQVTALEDNNLVYRLCNPGSDVDLVGGGLQRRRTKVPVTEILSFGFDLRDGDQTKRIWIPRGEARPDGESTKSDSEIEMRTLVITVYPVTVGSDDNVLFDEIMPAQDLTSL